MTTRLYIVRHGQSFWNINNRIQGIRDTELTKTGIKQAQLLAERLKGENIDCVYSSDLTRAYDTAKIIAEKFNLSVCKIPELKEISFGIWEGLTSEEVNSLYHETYSLWKTNPEKVIIEGAETLKEVQNRILSGTYKLIEQNKDKNILLVSHGTSIKALILGLLGIDLSFYTKIKLDNTCLNIIDIKDDGKIILVLLNDTCHLRSDKY